MAMKTGVKAFMAVYAVGLVPFSGYVWTRDCDVKSYDGTRSVVGSSACTAAATAIWPVVASLKMSAILLSEENLARIGKIKLQVE
jgi:hypothetical protein